MTDFVNCLNCGEMSNISGLVGQTTDDCPKCGKPVLIAPLEWQPLWDAMEANPSEWIETTDKMYWDMLESVPPRAQNSRGFLVGEPLSDNAEGYPIYACFKKSGDNYYAKNLTLSEFRGEV